MKKSEKLLTIILSAVLMVGICFGVTGCNDKEDCIPKSLGKAEGLYLYYDNYRTLTDGTEKETLVTDITIDGVTYSEEEREIVCLKYLPSVKEIVYSIELCKDGKTSYCIWHYNYDSKESGLVKSLAYYEWIYVSDYYVYLPNSGTLLDLHLNVVEDSFQAKSELLGDCLFYYGYNEFAWWKDGKFFEIETVKKQLDGLHVFVTGDYAYLFYDSVLFMVDMNTGEYKKHSFANGEILKDWKGFAKNDGKNYCITTSSITETDVEYFPLETGCRLYCLQGLEISLVYTFNENYQVEIKNYNEQYLNFTIEQLKPRWLLDDKKRTFDGYYDLSKNEFVKGKNIKIEEIKENFKIGEYEFYTSSQRYGPLMTVYNCYYLHRITDGNDEILQYYFDESRGYAPNPVLFDDIYIK